MWLRKDNSNWANKKTRLSQWGKTAATSRGDTTATKHEVSFIWKWQPLTFVLSRDCREWTASEVQSVFPWVVFVLPGVNLSCRCRSLCPCQISLSCREFVSLNFCFALTLVWVGRLPRAKIAWRIVTDAGSRFEIRNNWDIYAITWADFCQVSDLLFTSSLYSTSALYNLPYQP